MKRISSRDNPLFKELLKLAGASRQRRKSGQALLDGAHLVQACLAAGIQPMQVLVSETSTHDAEVSGLLQRLSVAPVTQLDDALFAALTELKTPTGIIALIAQPQPVTLVAHSRFALLLEDIQDPGNLGSMLRTAAAAGCDAVFLSQGCADAWSPKVLRAGMGGHFSLSIHTDADLPGVASVFAGQVLAGTLDAKQNLYESDLRGAAAFALGNEGAGLSQELLAAATQRITIPMPGKTESLNVAAAAAVCLFEAVRQRTWH